MTFTWCYYKLPDNEWFPKQSHLQKWKQTYKNSFFIRKHIETNLFFKKTCAEERLRRRTAWSGNRGDLFLWVFHVFWGTAHEVTLEVTNVVFYNCPCQRDEFINDKKVRWNQNDIPFWSMKSNITILQKNPAISKFRITCCSVMLINDDYPVQKFSFRSHGYDMFYQITKKTRWQIEKGYVTL